MSTQIFKCNLKDAKTIANISSICFNQTYKDFNSKNDMDEYINTHFNVSTIKNELQKENVEFYCLSYNSEPVGYFRLNYPKTLKNIKNTNSIELSRVYVLNEFQGKGFGRILIEKAINVAKKANKKHIWLSVWTENKNAIGFYKRYNFYIDGKTKFKLGQDIQEDYIMKKDVNNF